MKAIAHPKLFDMTISFCKAVIWAASRLGCLIIRDRLLPLRPGFKLLETLEYEDGNPGRATKPARTLPRPPPEAASVFEP